MSHSCPVIVHRLSRHWQITEVLTGSLLPMLRCDLNVLLGVTTLLGTPLSVTAAALSTAPSVAPQAAPQAAPQPAPASERSFQVFVKTLIGKTITLEVYGSTKVEELKFMLQEAEGKPGRPERWGYQYLCSLHVHLLASWCQDFAHAYLIVACTQNL